MEKINANLSKEKSEIKKKIIFLLIKILVIILFVVILFGVFLGVKRMDGVAMDSSIYDGDLMLFDRLEKDFQVGDIVIYDTEDGEKVSAIVAVAGDELVTSDEGFLYINNEKYTDSAIFDTELGDKNNLKDGLTISSDKYYLINENLNDDNDSRRFGVIDHRDIKGKIIGLLRTRVIK